MFIRIMIVLEKNHEVSFLKPRHTAKGALYNLNMPGESRSWTVVQSTIQFDLLMIYEMIRREVASVWRRETTIVWAENVMMMIMGVVGIHEFGGMYMM